MSDSVTRLNAALESRYRVDRELGEGGMATVYLADDLRHERKVALKVLKPELAAVVGAERFLAEIKTTANLQHPHILPLFDSGEADSFLFYVMPYVEGESLRERLDREHQLPVDEAVQIAKDVAEALDYAHGRGVIHRDIKPANILLQAGKPVVSDFGIALALGAAGAGRLTETGLSLGTPHYMSPEQATGDLNVGTSTDIYALGCVLYEMLAGDPPYTASTPQAVLGQIVTGEPDPVRKRRKSVPPNVESVTRRALEKVPADRFPDGGTFAKALADPAFRYGPPAGTVVSPDHGWRRTVVVAVVAAGAAVVGSRAFTSRPTNDIDRIIRYDVEHSSFIDFDISADGRWFVRPEVSDGESRVLMLHRSADAEPRPIPGTDGATRARISPDQTRVAWTAGGDVSDVSVTSLTGGSTRPGVEISFLGDLEWLDDETLMFTTGSALEAVPAGGGREPSVLLDLGPNERFAPRSLHALPDGSGVLFGKCPTACAETVSVPTLWALDLERLETHPIASGVAARYHDGYVIVVSEDGAVLAAEFDLSELRVVGDFYQVLTGVTVQQGQRGGAGFRLSREGTLLYVSGGRYEDAPGPAYQLVRLDREGGVEPMDVEPIFFSGTFGSLAVSPDGSRVAFGQRTSEGEDVWVHNLSSGARVRLTRNPRIDTRPTWVGPDSVAYRAVREDGVQTVAVRAADGTGDAAEWILPRGQPLEIQVSPDRQHAVIREGSSSDPGVSRDLVAYRLDGSAERIPLLAEEFGESSPALSPDGRWLAYNSDESGRYEVFVRPFPDVDSGKIPISIGGGWSPIWTQNGDELIYLEPGGQFRASVVAARLDLEADQPVVSREILFDLSTSLAGNPFNAKWFDAMPDGETFVGVVPLGDRADERRTRIIVNFDQVVRDAVRR